MTSPGYPSDLPPGWISPIDSVTNRHYYVDTRATPPRIIWTHPLLDERYIRENPVATRERAKYNPVLQRGPTSPLPPLAQPQHSPIAPVYSRTSVDDASPTHRPYGSGQSNINSSSIYNKSRLSFGGDSSSSWSIPPPAPKKGVLRKRRHTSVQDDANKYRPPQTSSKPAQPPFYKDPLPYEITPFILPQRTNQPDLRYASPKSFLSNLPSPNQPSYPMDSKTAGPSDYEMRLAAKESMYSQRYVDYDMKTNAPLPMNHAPVPNAPVPHLPRYPFAVQNPLSHGFGPTPGTRGAPTPPNYTANNHGNGWQGGYQSQPAYYAGNRETGGRWTY